MPRSLRWQRLNRHPKHRFSMLKNLACSFFLHERILTTEAKAKTLLPIVNQIFSRAIKNSSISRGKLAGWLKQKRAIHKVYDNLLERYTVHAGGIAKLTPQAKARRGDNSKMAIIELVNKYKLIKIFFLIFSEKEEKEKDDYLQIKQKSGLDFSQWELFIRTRELKLYTEEKQKREDIYKKLKEKLKELKQISPVNYQKEMKRHLFGKELSLYKMRCDYLIPPQHYFQLYLKAAKSETELDEFYTRSISYFKDLIKRTKNQVQLLEEILRHPKKSQKYEKLNFSRYYSKLGDDMETLREENRSEENLKAIEERKEILNKYSLMKALAFESQKSQHNLEKTMFENFKEKGYDISNLNMEQLSEVMMSINLQQRAEILANNENGSDNINGVLSYDTNMENHLTRAEKKYLNDDYYKTFVSDENVENIVEDFEKVKSKYKEEKIRNAKYFELLRKYNDRQLRKSNKPDISEIEKYGDVEKFRRL